MTIITRSALVNGGILFNPSRYIPPDLHSIVDGREVTWAEVIESRRKRQRERLQQILRTDTWRPYRVWVAYFDQSLMGGWNAFIDRNNTDFGTWVCHARKPWLIPLLMRAFPLVLPLGSEANQWEMWKIAFAKRYKRNTHDGKPRGVAFVWWNGRDAPRLEKP